VVLGAPNLMPTNRPVGKTGGTASHTLPQSHAILTGAGGFIRKLGCRLASFLRGKIKGESE